MNKASTLYHGLVELLDRAQWRDKRHLKTAANMIMGLIFSGEISLTSWIPYVHCRALRAQSSQRRFSRWLHNDKLQVSHLYAPLIEEALWSWGESTLYLALDTTMLWDRYCMIRLSVVRGAARVASDRAWECASGF